MSEYQYYEFRAIDRSLDQEDIAALRRMSSRATITSSSFVNEYHYGDFKGDPDKLMESYFDAFVYYANWGTKYFKLRLPKSLLSPETALEYSGNDTLWVNSTDEHTIITFAQEYEESYDDWMESEGIMSSLVSLRSELAGGDLRCLYLGWLINNDCVYIDDDESEEDEPDESDGEESDSDDLEPPVPPGLKKLTASQKSLVEFFDIDKDLLAAAAQASLPFVEQSISKDAFHKWVRDLAPDVKDDLLIKVVEGRGQSIAMELSVQFERESNPKEPTSAGPARRTNRELQDLKTKVREQRTAKEKARAAAELKQRLDDLASRLPQVLNTIEEHAQMKKVNHYDDALKLLINVQALAERGDVPNFKQWLIDFRARHATKRALLERLDQAKL